MKRRMLEHGEQVALITWWAWSHKRYGVPEFALFAVPNAGAGASRGQAGKMKAEGARPGIPDLLLPVARGKYRGLAIEMKAGKNKPSAEQKKVIAWLRDQGWDAWVCYSSVQAIDEVKRYLSS